MVPEPSVRVLTAIETRNVSTGASNCASTRAMVSLALPGPNAVTMVIGLLG